MRKAFIDTLCNLAQNDKRIWLLTGDLGFSFLEQFAAKFPQRFVNIGVAEQNMAGIAAGLALSGNTVFMYSIANFPVFRCLEQIRNDICYHNANVKIVSVGAGMAYGSAGYTHHGIEDIGVMRLMPNITVVSPADPIETKLAVTAIAQHPGPCYLRLGKSNEPILHQVQLHFELSKAIIVTEGSDITLIANGSILKVAIEAAEQLKAQGYQAEIISVPVVKPFDTETILKSVHKTKRVITIEEHGVGGLATAVAETIAGIKCRFSPILIKQGPATVAADQQKLREMHGLNIDSLLKTAKEML
jgi:transketolase